VRGEFLDLGGARLYYYAAGTRGAGVPVVFLHGFSTSSHLWSDVVPLMPAGHRLVVLDLLGYGRSDRPLTHPVDVGAHADRIVAMLDELRIDRACIVGHGMGGGIAQTVAIRHAARVSHLCLIDSVAFDRWPIAGGRLARAALPAARWLPSKVLLGVLRRELARGYVDPARGERSIDLYLRPFADAGGQAAIVAHLRALAGGGPADVAPRLSTLTLPTSLVWGEHDRLVPVSLAYRLETTIPRAALDVIDDAGHFTPEESPRRIADAIATLLERR